MKKELRIFFTALMFFTRIPCPPWVDHSEEYIAKSTRYFSLVGILVGTIGSILFYISSFIFPQYIAILISMAATIITTGAFHEDGLADVCDGFGGGWKKEDILRIMKDSRIGAFGVIGLMVTLSLKFSCLFQINTQILPIILITGHAVSRFAASSLIYSMDYVRDENTSKVKPAAQQMSTLSLMTGAFFSLLPFMLFQNAKYFLLLIPILMTTWLLKRYFMKWIGGYTGDCLGAAQQITEVIFYLSAVALWKFI